MLPRNHLDRIQIAFDDHRLVANAGLILPITLARHLGLSQLVQQHLDLGDAPGRANAGFQPSLIVTASFRSEPLRIISVVQLYGATVVCFAAALDTHSSVDHESLRFIRVLPAIPTVANHPS